MSPEDQWGQGAATLWTENTRVTLTVGELYLAFETCAYITECGNDHPTSAKLAHKLAKALVRRGVRGRQVELWAKKESDR